MMKHISIGGAALALLLAPTMLHAQSAEGSFAGDPLINCSLQAKTVYVDATHNKVEYSIRYTMDHTQNYNADYSVAFEFGNNLALEHAGQTELRPTGTDLSATLLDWHGEQIFETTGETHHVQATLDGVECGAALLTEVGPNFAFALPDLTKVDLNVNLPDLIEAPQEEPGDENSAAQSPINLPDVEFNPDDVRVEFTPPAQGDPDDANPELLEESSAAEEEEEEEASNNGPIVIEDESLAERLRNALDSLFGNDDEDEQSGVQVNDNSGALAGSGQNAPADGQEQIADASEDDNSEVAPSAEIDEDDTATDSVELEDNTSIDDSADSTSKAKSESSMSVGLLALIYALGLSAAVLLLYVVYLIGKKSSN